MPNFDSFESVPRRELDVIYVLDTSGSMNGLPIQRLNAAMGNTVDALQQMARHNGNAHVKIAVLEFNSMCRWMQPAGPEDLEDFFWTDLEASGMTYMGTALKELNSKLSRHAFLNSMTGSFLPVIIFMTDGYANDDSEVELAQIMQNKWFRNATRVGFAIGRNPDVQMIAKLVGDSEAVIRTEDLGVFARLLRFVTVSASTLASTSHTVDAAASGAAAVASAINDAGVDRDQVAPGFDYKEQDVFPQEPGTSDWDDISGW